MYCKNKGDELYAYRNNKFYRGFRLGDTIRLNDSIVFSTKKNDMEEFIEFDLSKLSEDRYSDLRDVLSEVLPLELNIWLKYYPHCTCDHDKYYVLAVKFDIIL